MTTLYESFNKTNGNTLGPDLTWTVVGSTFATDTNRATLISTGGIRRAYANALSTEDHYVEATLDAVTNSGASVRLCARMDATAGTFYAFEAVEDNTGSGYCYIVKFVGNTRTVLLDTSTSFAFPFHARLEVEGSTLRAYLEGYLLGSITDTAITGKTLSGISGLQATASSVFWEDFAAGDLNVSPVSSLTEPFTRANGPGIGSAATWEPSTPGAFSTLGNKAVITEGVYTQVHARCLTPMTTDNMLVLAVGAYPQNTYPIARVCARMDNDTWTFYALEAQAASGYASIVKYVNSVRTVLLEYAGDISSDAMTAGGWGLEVDGDTLTPYYYGTAYSQFAITDTSITTGQHFGISGSDGYLEGTWDSITATALAATPTDQHESGGSTAAVTVNPEGAGTAAEAVSGGSTATITIDAQAGGSFREVAYWSEPEAITVASLFIVSVTVGGDEVLLSWDAQGTAGQYAIERNGIIVGQTATTSYTDTPGVGDHTYYVLALEPV